MTQLQQSTLQLHVVVSFPFAIVLFASCTD
jgi:hypothetical protein